MAIQRMEEFFRNKFPVSFFNCNLMIASNYFVFSFEVNILRLE